MATKNLILKLGLKGVKGANSGLNSVSNTVGGLSTRAIQAGAAFFIGKGIIQGIKQTVQLSGQLKQTSQAFNNLTKDLKGQGDALGLLQQATNGTVDSIDLMTQANNAMLLGIFDSKEEMADMFDVAQRLGAALGQDTLFGVESLVTGMGRQSKLMLDNLGIMVDTEEANKRFAEANGLVASSLTDSQKKQAFNNETMRQAKLLVADLGEEQLTTADRLKALGASARDLQGQLGDALTPAVDKALGILTDFSEVAVEGVGVLSKIDILETGKSILNNTSALLNAIKELFKITIDGIPELFKFAFEKISPIVGNAFQTIIEFIKDTASYIFEPISVGAEIISAKLQNIFIGMFNSVKEQFNSFAETFVGEKLGIQKLGMTDFIDIEGLNADLSNTDFVKAFAEDNINNIQDFREKHKEILANYFSEVAVMKEENDLIDDERTANNFAKAEESVQNTLTLEEFQLQESIKKIQKRASELKKAGVADVELQKFITKEKTKLLNLETQAKASQTGEFFALAAQASSLDRKQAGRTKVLRSAEALVSAYSAAAKAFERFGGYPGGLVPAALSLGIGLDNVAKINSVGFASGGIVPGVDSGSGDTVPAMLTPGEVILNRSQQENLVGNMGGLTINFNSPVTNEDFVKDFIIPEIENTVRGSLA